MTRLQPNRWIELLIRPIFLVPLLIVIGFTGLYISTIIRNAYTVLYPSVLVLSAICFLLLKDRTSLSDFIWGRDVARYVLVAFFMVIFFLVVQYHGAGFWRTDSVFYFTFLLYTLAGSYIITGGRTIVAIILICLAGLTNRITALYASVEYIGIDIYHHTKLVQSIIGEDSLAGFASTKYFYAPLYHIQTAQGQLLFDVGTKDALTLTTMLSVVIVSVFIVFILTNRLWNRQIALLASLLYTGSEQAIKWGIDLIPTSLGIVFFSVALFSLVVYYLNNDKRMFIIFICAIASLMYTHQVSLFISAALVVGFSIAVVAYTFSIPTQIANISLFTGLAIMADFITTKYGGPEGSQSFFQQVLGVFIESLVGSGTTTRPEVALPADPRISGAGAAALSNIQIAGSSLLLFFAILGALFWLHKRDKNRTIFAGLLFSVGVTTLLVFTLGFPIVGMRSLLPGRWWAFTYILLATLAAPGLVMFARSIAPLFSRSKTSIPLLLMAILILYIVLMGGAAAASADNPFFDNGFSTTRHSITATEQALGEHANMYDTESTPVVGDFRYRYTSQTIVMDYYDPQSIASESPKLVANREFLNKKAAMYMMRFEGSSTMVHGGVPIRQLNPKYRSTVYSTGNNELLFIRK